MKNTLVNLTVNIFYLFFLLIQFLELSQTEYFDRTFHKGVSIYYLYIPLFMFCLYIAFTNSRKITFFRVMIAVLLFISRFSAHFFYLCRYRHLIIYQDIKTPHFCEHFWSVSADSYNISFNRSGRYLLSLDWWLKTFKNVSALFSIRILRLSRSLSLNFFLFFRCSLFLLNLFFSLSIFLNTRP